MNRICGIYQIKSFLYPDRIYIGSAKDILSRWRSHYCNLRKGKRINNILQNHYNKYGKTDLQFSILEVCEQSELLQKEQHYIDTLNPYFNICKIAGNTLGVRCTEEKRAKQSKLMMGNKYALGGKGLLGKIHTQQSKDKNRLSHLGKKFKLSHTKKYSSEHNSKISKSLLGNN